MFKKLLSLSNLTLLTALSLSTVAAYYSIYGLTAIFAGAVIPIIVMGSILEVGKICTTVWLRKYWKRCSLILKLYLVPAVVLLAFLTSMGIFGFLSKAHSDQSLVSGDVQGKLAIYDEKIKTARENIDSNRKQLKQMDDAVDQVMGRSTTEEGATKANNIRKSQQRDRSALAKDIEAQQKLISQLNDESAPIRAENRKVEAEVGPIKYIAAFIYGDNPDSNLLERAVRWVIILIVIVFDPLAIALVLAANASKEWDEEKIEEPEFTIQELDTFVGEKPTIEEIAEYEADDGPLTDEQTEHLKKLVEEFKEDPHPVGWMFEDPGEHPSDQFQYTNEFTEETVEPVLSDEQIDRLGRKLAIMDALKKPVVEEEITADSTEIVDPIVTEGVTVEEPTSEKELKEIHGVEGYVLVDGRHMNKEVAMSLHPELFQIKADNVKEPTTNFGATFPAKASKGDTFVRVDVLPNRVFKFDGSRWIEINKENTDSYLHNIEYIKHLVSMIETGQYDVELLSDNEKLEIEEYLRNQNS
jgi:hypothetical protein